MCKIAGRIILFILISWLIGFSVFYFSIPQSAPRVTKTVDAIVVLTGACGRVSHGIRLLQEKKANKLFISGVNKQISKNQISSLLDDNAKKIFKSLHKQITLGYNATNTLGNATETKDWTTRNNIKSIILVTSNYHIPRSIAEFKRCMPNINITISPVMSNITLQISNISKLLLVISEYNKYIYRITVSTLHL